MKSENFKIEEVETNSTNDELVENENEAKESEHEDRDSLLDEYDKEQTRDKNLDFKTLFLVLLCMLTVLTVILPDVYIKNQIYYISRDINKLDEQKTVLEEEHRDLMRKIEAIQFKNQVLDDFLFEDE